MSHKKALFYIFFIVISILFVSTFFAAAAETIYINGEEVSDNLDVRMVDNNLMVNARSLADELEVNLVWASTIKTLTLSEGNTTIKMMVDSSYIQINDSTFRVPDSLKLIDGSSYIILEDVVEGFGYLYREENASIYINRPESYVQSISWKKDGQQLEINMNKLSPYRISNNEDPNRLVLELDKAALADDFSDELSNKNFYLRVNRVPDKARLRFQIISQHPIPFQREVGVVEDGNNLLINFLPQIEAIDWADGRLNISANGLVSAPDMFLLQDPRRLIIDIPDVMLSQHELNLPENEIIKDIRVSQFQYDPLILRVVVELSEGSYLRLVDSDSSEEITLREGQVTKVDHLRFEDNRIIFYSNHSINPDIFTLDSPDRLVFNVINAVRGDNFYDQINVNEQGINTIRTSRFNNETVRMVVDLEGKSDYSFNKEAQDSGGYRNIITFAKSVEDITINVDEEQTGINICLNNKANYNVKKVGFPDRLLVDIEGVKIDETITLPESAGLVKDIRISQLQEDVGRIVFELKEYHEHQLYSTEIDDVINIGVKTGESRPVVEKNAIVIDPGHGGFDPGAIGPSGLMEKTVNLQIAKKVEELLKNKNYEVVLTRENDTFISLKDRADMANDLDAKLFVSIHANASASSRSSGTEVYIAPGKVTNSRLLARLIQDNLLNSLKLDDRGVKHGNLYVVKETKMPAVLVEVAFLSNPHEESLLSNDLFLNKAARAIVDGIVEYLESIE